MKKLSGEFLSRILWTLQQANSKELTRDDILASLTAAFDVKDLYVDIPESKQLGSVALAKRLATFDKVNLERLDAMLPWSSFNELPGKRTLGSAWSSQKRHTSAPFPDPLVVKLNQRMPLKGLKILELGCFEGHHSVSLARHAYEVWAIDGRIENVIKTLVRIWMAEMERIVAVNFLDLEQGTLKQQLELLGRKEGFDLVHHRGVLYHLSNPVSHLAQCAEISNKHIYLHTQIATPEQAKDKLIFKSKEYAVYRYREPKVQFAPFAGITTHAHWMTEVSLLELLRDLGFKHIDIIANVVERNGLRIELIASKKGEE
jgi:2-polyprenyl-3-methyl-5-hydroxy-6-metoxy-1,4-benzoquinol methylase